MTHDRRHPGALLFIGETESEAKEKLDMLNSLIPRRVAMQRLSANLGGVDLSKFDLDAPLPDIPVNNARVSAVESYLAISRREGLTLRQMAMRSAAAKHHWTLVGSVKQIADELESWFLTGAADGFNVLPSDVPGAINALVDKLVPELQRRGLFSHRIRRQDAARKSRAAPAGGSLKALLSDRDAASMSWLAGRDEGQSRNAVQSPRCGPH